MKYTRDKSAVDRSPVGCLYMFATYRFRARPLNHFERGDEGN